MQQRQRRAIKKETVIPGIFFPAFFSGLIFFFFFWVFFGVRSEIVVASSAIGSGVCEISSSR